MASLGALLAPMGAAAMIVPQLVNNSRNISGNTISGTLAQNGDAASSLLRVLELNSSANSARSQSYAERQMDFQRSMSESAMQFNSAEAAKNRDWQEMMSNTAHQREVADLKAAGLNPVLSATGGNGAAVGSGSAASGYAPSGASGAVDASYNQVIGSILGALISADTQLKVADVNAKTNLELQDKNSALQTLLTGLTTETSRYVSDNNLAAAGVAAAAARYGADRNYSATELTNQTNKVLKQMQLDFDALHPNSVWSTAGSIATGATNILGNLFGLGKVGSGLTSFGSGVMSLYDTLSDGVKSVLEKLPGGSGRQRGEASH